MTDNARVCHEALEILSRDLATGIRLGVAMNPNSSIGILVTLTTDCNINVSEQAKSALKDRDALSELLGE